MVELLIVCIFDVLLGTIYALDGWLFAFLVPKYEHFIPLID